MIKAIHIISGSCVLAVLYFGRDVFQALALAAILSIALAPLTRRFTRLGLGRVPATLATVILAAVCLAGLAGALVFQLSDLTADVPRYKQALQVKAEQLRVLAERPFIALEARLQGSDGASAAAPALGVSGKQAAPAAATPVLARPGMRDTVTRMLSQVWGPIGQAGIVLVLFIFISLERESLQDRLIRLAGNASLSRTVQTLVDAGQGISRFFFAQVVVNISFALAVTASLWALQVPHAVLWGALSGILRFVPYLGMLIAGAAIGLFSAAVDPGWALAVWCMALFLVLELLVAYLVEPRVYGHSSGLSPLAVIVAALFWGALWGPVGLILSTPLTLCLVVAGRHVPALAPLTTLLGAAPSVSAAQRFYQRALAGDIAAIVRDGQAVLKRSSLAAYCDRVLIPGLTLAMPDIQTGRIDEAQLGRLRKAMAEATEALTAPGSGGPGRRRAVPLLDTNVGAHLRKLRQARSGQWQGSLDVPAHSVFLCAGLGSDRDDFLTELLVRALNDAGADARSMVLNGDGEHPGEEKAYLVSAVILPYPQEAELGAWLQAVADLRTGLPEASLVTIKLPLDGKLTRAAEASVDATVDLVLQSFEQARSFAVADR